MLSKCGSPRGYRGLSVCNVGCGDLGVITATVQAAG